MGSAFVTLCEKIPEWGKIWCQVWRVNSRAIWKSHRRVAAAHSACMFRSQVRSCRRDPNSLRQRVSIDVRRPITHWNRGHVRAAPDACARLSDHRGACDSGPCDYTAATHFRCWHFSTVTSSARGSCTLLAKAIDALPTKGVLVLAEWDRATRSLMDGIQIMERVHKRGAFIKVLDRSGLDLTAPSGRGILALLSGLAEEERTRILRRANEARIAAIKRGTRLGRSLSPSSCSNCDVATSNSQLRAGRSADRRGSEGADTVPR
jgi:Resolvase, N terminal domain